MHLILLRHCTRVDKVAVASPGTSVRLASVPNPSASVLPSDGGTTISGTTSSAGATSTSSDPTSWLSPFDPPVDPELATQEVEAAVRKMTSHVRKGHENDPIRILLHCSPYNRCVQTAERLYDGLVHTPGSGASPASSKLRIDQALSEWLSESFNLNYLPPNDDGYSMINNVNTYLNGPDSGGADSSRQKLLRIKDPLWSYNRLGHCGDYGEPPLDFKRRCFDYLTHLLQYYYRHQSFEDDQETVIIVISHGAVVSTLLQLLLNKPIFNEIPVCTPVYFKQSSKRRLSFNLMDYDFNLNQILTFSSDKELYRMLETPINMGLLDFDNLSGTELTIGSSEYTTVLQSPSPSMGRSRSSSRGSSSSNNNGGSKSGRRRKRRSNTIGSGPPTLEGVEMQIPQVELSTLRQTRSSKQLHTMNRRSDGKQIDLNKLASYFDNSSDEDSDYDGNGDANGGSVSTDDDDANSITSNIPSLSGLNARMSMNRGSIESLKDLLDDNSLSQQGRSSLASKFLEDIFKDTTPTGSDRTSETEEVLTFDRGSRGDPQSPRIPIIEGTFSKVPFGDAIDEDSDIDTAMPYAHRPTFTLSGSPPIEKSHSQIQLISTWQKNLSSPEDSKTSLREILYEKGKADLTESDTDSDTDTGSDDAGWFGFNAGAQPVQY